MWVGKHVIIFMHLQFRCSLIGDQFRKSRSVLRVSVCSKNGGDEFAACVASVSL